MTDRLQALSDAGVSIWLDDLSRERIETGNLAELIKEKHVVGVTTNPTIFASAIADGERYDEQVGKLVADGADVTKVIFELTTEDVRNACDVMKPVADGSPSDGRVSIEVEPDLANDTEGTIDSAQKLWQAVDRPNVLIKIPATKEGLPAITAAIAEGISVNVTLIFGIERYREVMDAYLSGLEQARDAGLDLGKIQSVASFFVSRVDTEVDKRLDEIGTDEAKELKGKVAVANAWRCLRRVRGGARQRPLEAAGGRRRQPAAAAVGVDRREEPGLLRHALRHRAGRGRHRQHDAREDPRGVRRPRRGRGRHGHRQGTRRGRRDLHQLEAVGVDFEDVLVAVETRGCRQVQEVVDRAGRDRREADGAGGHVTEWNTVSGTSYELFFGYPDEQAFSSVVEQLVADGVAGKVAGQDATLWGPDGGVRGGQAALVGRLPGELPRAWSATSPRSRSSTASGG